MLVAKSSGVTLVVEFNLPLLVPGRSEDRPLQGTGWETGLMDDALFLPGTSYAVIEIVGIEALQLEHCRLRGRPLVLSWP